MDSENKVENITKNWFIVAIINLIIFIVAVPYYSVRAIYVVLNDLDLYLLEKLFFLVYLIFTIIINALFRTKYGRFFNFFKELKRYNNYKNEKE